MICLLRSLLCLGPDRITCLYFSGGEGAREAADGFPSASGTSHWVCTPSTTAGVFSPFPLYQPFRTSAPRVAAPHQAPGHWLLPLTSGFGEEEGGKEALELAEGCQYLLLVPSTHPCLRVVIQHDYISRHNSKGRERKAIQLAGFNTHHVCTSKRRRKHEQSPTTPRAA